MVKRRPMNKPLRVSHDISELPVVCTAPEAGLLLRKYPEQICKMARDGILPGQKQGNAWYFRRDDLARYLETARSPKTRSPAHLDSRIAF